MKHLKLASIALALTALSGVASATESSSAVVDALSKYKVSLGTVVHHETYRETYAGARVMQEKGVLQGLTGSAQFDLNPTTKLQVNGTYAVGNSKYTGSYQGGNYGDVQIDGIGRRLTDVSGVFKFSPAGFHGVTFNSGIGYRTLTDRLSEAGPGGYDRKNRMLYGVVGAERTYALGDTWSATPGVNIRLGLKADQHSDVEGGMTKKQNSIVGTELAVKFQSGNKKLPLQITPHVRHYKVGESEEVNGWVEPSNKTTEVGVTMALQF